MGKTRDLFKKIRDTLGTFHAKMDSIKDKNGMDLTEAEEMLLADGKLKLAAAPKLIGCLMNYGMRFVTL